jgi:DNA-binding NarL/FixJ family response regulator
MVVAPSTFLAGAVSADVVVPPQLSQRERDVLTLLADGTSVKDIAPALGIALNTCRGYVKAVREKLEANSQLEGVLKARELGLLDDD